MSLSVSCPNCGKQFKNIKPELVGKKAKCACGQIVRLSDAGVKTSDGDPSLLPDDLMQVDLLGDELIGDELLGNMLPGPSSAPAVNTDRNRLQGTSEPEHPDVKQLTSSKRETAKPQPAPIESSGSKPAPIEEAIFDQSYSDLDSILEGVGDAAPIAARPRPREEVEDSDAPGGEAIQEKRKGSPVGFLAALLSGTIAVWFGAFAMTSKFKVIDQFLTSAFSEALNSMYVGDLGSSELSEVNERFQIFFMVFGWVFWTVALCLMVLGATQVLNSLYRLFAKRNFFRSIDGLTATFGVVALFLLVGWIFAQASLERAQHKYLNEYEKPATIIGQKLEVVTQLREEIDAQHKLIRNRLLMGALVPMSVFALSMTRLFTLKPDRRRVSGTQRG